MRLALLGADDQTLALVAAVNREHDQIVMMDTLAAGSQEARAAAPDAELAADWNALLDPQAIDGVIVAADQPAVRVEQLKRLIQVGMPALVSHPVCLSMLDCYELEMIRGEAKGIVLANLPARWHPAAIELGEMVDRGEESPIGSAEQIVFERFLPTRERETVLRQFARDADLLQFLAGDATKLHALGSGSEAARSGPYANLAVQMTCDNGLVCRWS